MINNIKIWLGKLVEVINAGFDSKPFDFCKLRMVRVKVRVNNKRSIK